jgi:DNA-binding transcriptional LysR family regulator
VDRLVAMQILAEVADRRSFRAAASALGLSPTVVSARVRELEDHLGVRLLERTTRRVSLTLPGVAFLERVRAALDLVREAESEASSLSGDLRGVLRVNAPVTFGTHRVAPAIGSFLRAHPRTRVELTLEDRKVDLVREGVDVALRVGHMQDSTLVARRITTARMVACAAPRYLEERGTPGHPSELTAHVCLAYSLSSEGATWTFALGDERVTVRTADRLLCNNGEALVRAAEAGIGIAREPDFIVEAAIAAGRLVEVLAPWSPPGSGLGVFAVYPSGRHLSAMARAFVDHFASQAAGAARVQDIDRAGSAARGTVRTPRER